MSRTPIRDSPRVVTPAPHFVIPAKAGIQGEGCGGSTQHRPLLVTSLQKSQTTSREKIVARSKTTRGEGLVPRLGGVRPAHTTIPHPNHPNILDIQHRYSGESRNPEGWGRGNVAWGLVPRFPRPLTGSPIFIPCRPAIRHSRDDGNPRTNVPRTTGDRQPRQ